MNSRPPGASSAATTPAQRRMSGSQQSAPIPVNTRSNAPAPSTLGRVVDVGLDEVDVGAGRGGEPARLGERGRGEVEPGHPRAEPRQRDRVGADVALQVHAAQAR